MVDVPADICNQALDQIGADVEIGDLEEGTKAARVCLRHYGQCRDQLLRAAYWNFAQARIPLVLLADSTGQTADVGTLVPEPWKFEYAYPEDCLKARMIPAVNAQQSAGVPSGNISISTAVPQIQNLNNGNVGVRQVPAAFTIANDPNVPNPTEPKYLGMPTGRTVILTNIPSAQLIYTRRVLTPTEWDPLFRDAFVAYLAQAICLGVLKDKKMAMALRSQQIALAREKILSARAADGNEGPHSSDISVDWMRARNSGHGWRGPSSTGPDSGYNSALWANEVGWNSGGPFGPAIDPLPFSDGSTV